MARLTGFLLAALLALGSTACVLALPVRVVNTPERPVPVAPMGVSQDSEGNTVKYNEQLWPQGKLVSQDTYKDPGGGFFVKLLAALPGGWGEIAVLVMSLLGIGGATHGYTKSRSKDRELEQLKQERDFHKNDADEGWKKALEGKPNAEQ